jgi:hypothetical protein
MRPDVVVEYRRTHPPRIFGSLGPRNDDNSPPRPGGVPMRLRAKRSFTNADGITQRRGRIRSWRAAS